MKTKKNKMIKRLIIIPVIIPVGIKEIDTKPERTVVLNYKSTYTNQCAVFVWVTQLTASWPSCGQ